MEINLGNGNISLRQFQEISSGGISCHMHLYEEQSERKRDKKEFSMRETSHSRQ
jgi:hypothetical protein